MTKYSVKSIVIASLAALLLASLQSSLFMTSFVICIAPIVIAALYAWAGPVPAAIMSAGTLLSMGSYASVLSKIMSVPVSSAALCAAALVVLVLPALVCIVVIEKKRSFAERMAACIMAQTGALLLLCGVMYLGLRMDLVDVITSLMRLSMDELPVTAVASMMEMFAALGFLTAESVEELTTGFVIPSDVARVLDQAFDYISYYMRQVMPAMVIHSGMLTGIVMTSVSGAIIARRERDAEETDEEEGEEEACEKRMVEHVPMVCWQVPRRALGMMLVGMVTGVVLQMRQIDFALAVTAVFSLLLSSLLIIQGLAAISRIALRSGMSDGFRIGVMVIVLIFFMQFLEIVGAASALFGSHGVVSQWMQKRMEESRKDDDEE